MAADDIGKTAVILPFELFEYLRMSFALRNAAQTSQSSVDDVTREIRFGYAYVDDRLDASIKPEEHRRQLHELFSHLPSWLRPCAQC